METERTEVEIKFFALSVLAVVLVEAALRAAVSREIIPPLPATGLARMMQITLFLFVFSFGRNGLSAIGLDKYQLKSGMKKGFIWSAGFGVAVAVGFVIIFLFGKNPFSMINAGLPSQTEKLVVFLIVAGLVGPVAEEIFFRGILYGFIRGVGILAAGIVFKNIGEKKRLSLSRVFGAAAAVLASTAIFAGLHPAAGFTQAMGGLLFAVSYEIEGKLMTPIVIHVLGNMAIYLVSAVF